MEKSRVDRQPKRRRGVVATDQSSCNITTLPVTLRPPAMPALEASEYLLKDTVLTNSAIRQAVQQLRRGRYHPIIVLYAGLPEWDEKPNNLSLYTPELILEEWPHNTREGHQFTIMHILRCLQLSVTQEAVVELDRGFLDVLNRSALIPTHRPPIDLVPMFTNREWIRAALSLSDRTRGSRHRQSLASFYSDTRYSGDTCRRGTIGVYGPER